MDSAADALARLKGLPGIVDAYQVLTFECYRRGKDGGVHTVRVEVLDAGPDPALAARRYSARARGQDGLFAGGNPARTVAAALFSVQWGAWTSSGAGPRGLPTPGWRPIPRRRAAG